MKILYERKKRVRDRVMRCYLSLDCPANCRFCSANIPAVHPEYKRAVLDAGVWAAGINRRGRKALLAGGEPLCYPQMRELLCLIDRGIPLEIYSNLIPDISDVLAADRPLRWLISLHPAVDDYELWYRQVNRLIAAGHAVRFHVIKQGNWEERTSFLKNKGMGVTCCDDQRNYIKSTAANPGPVWCSTYYYVYGPDGWRYPCVTKLGLGENPISHISEDDETDESIVRCNRFGSCAACDNLVEGKVWQDE